MITKDYIDVGMNTITNRYNGCLSVLSFKVLEFSRYVNTLVVNIVVRL